MKAMVLTEVKRPLSLREIHTPQPAHHQVLIRVSTCGVCRTDLHIFDGELIPPHFPLVLGHQIIGYVEALGEAVKGVSVGERVGVPWLGSSCGTCDDCRSGKENLCCQALYTGFHINGGYAEYCVADARYIFAVPAGYSDVQAAPLFCAGLIGYRALRFTEKGKRIGFYGFGASAHLLIQVARHQGAEVYVFTRPQDFKGQERAKERGAVWAGGSDEAPPTSLDAAIIFASVGALIPAALKVVKRGGVVICAGIHMSAIPSFSYDLLWEERVIRSVANLTREDGKQFLSLAPRIPLITETTAYPLAQANAALEDLRTGQLQGSAVLIIDSRKSS